MTAQDDETHDEHEDRAKTGNSSWTAEAIRALGATTDLQTLAGIFGCSGWSSRKMARTGECERQGIKIFRIGAHYRVGVQSVLDVLGFSSGDLSTPAKAGLVRGPGWRDATDSAVIQASGPAAAGADDGAPQRARAGRKRRTGRMASRPGSANRYRWRPGSPPSATSGVGAGPGHGKERGACARPVGTRQSWPAAAPPAASRAGPGCTTSETPRTRQYERGPVSSPCGRRSTHRVLTDILRFLRTTAERLSYRAEATAGQRRAGQPEIARAGEHQRSVRACSGGLLASGGWPEPGGDPAWDGPHSWRICCTSG
jgi:hypothetical protein